MIALIDYGMGNLLSVAKALQSVGAEIAIVDNAAAIERANSVVLPGVGHFKDGMAHLRERGLADAVLSAISAGKPFLGICLGMQMLMEGSEEAPGVPGLGIFKGQVVRFPKNSAEKVPHMGWNSISIKAPSCPCLKGVPEDSYFYFVHSYYPAPETPEVTLAACEYIVPFAAIIGRDNVFATQFHPEKSQDKGLTILRNFVSLP
ncbi:MAG: imidazole glycerol phosphate synthase, glutamine amidotransferase subunit [Lentisphaerae bacterium GWF2_52_8]|nr:MAG: imidazole glycerol phosphate synthase, glutamine amidotransferase subunit [Lentisphaerae bacterium GWF2_52_8]